MNEKKPEGYGKEPEETLDEPVMDGATDHSDDDVDPRKGDEDPALIRDLEEHEPTVNPYA